MDKKITAYQVSFALVVLHIPLLALVLVVLVTTMPPQEILSLIFLLGYVEHNPL